MQTLIDLGLALALGLLVGVERGWQERGAAEGSRIAGIRTFGLIGLLGGLWQLLAGGAGDVLLGLAFLAFALLMVIAHAAEARVSNDYGVTTLVATLITFVLGALSVRGQQGVAASGAVVTAVILSLKPMLHHWLERIEPNELAAALKLLLISVVILPVLPDQGFGPWQALNPYELWWLVRPHRDHILCRLLRGQNRRCRARNLVDRLSRRLWCLRLESPLISPAWPRKGWNKKFSPREYWSPRRRCLSECFS